MLLERNVSLLLAPVEIEFGEKYELETDVSLVGGDSLDNAKGATSDSVDVASGS